MLFTKSVEIPVGAGRMPAYVARPEGAETRPAIIVLEEIFGINSEMKRITELVASAGYVGIAPNYFHRTDPHMDLPYDQSGIQQGLAAAKHVTRETLAEDIRAAAAWLRSQPFVNGHVGTWGFCIGGSVAFYSATLPEIDAACSFYGSMIARPLASGEPEMLADAAKVHTPLFFAFGGKDESLPPTSIERIRETLTADGKAFDLHVYPDEGHGFFRHGVNGEATPGARAVWSLVQAFFKRTL
ncbi:MAG TPA: dienelactone hydrolase family protein [Candidatus Dormibacteraeota bacterium]|nr:dienelactone hydrolase family protein [Candidatus Dormibacteraeota bacterium]